MRKNQGQTLLEVVIAIALLVLVLTVMVSASVASMANNRLAKERAVATRLAQSAQDWLRGQRDSAGWSVLASAFPTATTYYCLGEEESYPIDTTTPPITTQTTFISPCSSSTDLVSSVISSNATYYRRLKIDTEDEPDVALKAKLRNYTITVYWYSGKSTIESVQVQGKLTKWE